MRFDLGIPLAAQQSAAIKSVTQIARAAHLAHEDEGGVAFDHLPFVEDEVSYNFHMLVQQRRMAAISAIRAAAHGAEIDKIVSDFRSHAGMAK